MTPRPPKRTFGSRRTHLIFALSATAFCGTGQLTAVAAGTVHRSAGVSSRASEAGRHFRRGVELFNDGDLAAATAEFSRAYQIVPSFMILYNLGQIAYQRQDYVTAVDHFRRYLADGGDEISAERRKQVEQDVRRLDERIGQIEVETRDTGAEVLLDGVTVGTAPLRESIAANVGRRRLEIVSTSGIQQGRTVDIVGGETTHVRFGSAVASPVASISERSVRPKEGPQMVAALPQPSLLAETSAEREQREHPPSPRSTWVAWSAAGLLGAGAVATGALALSAARNLQQTRDSFPVMPGSLDAEGHRARVLAWTSDGLLAGTVLMAALSSYLTFRSPNDAILPENRPGLDE